MTSYFQFFLEICLFFFLSKKHILSILNWILKILKGSVLLQIFNILLEQYCHIVLVLEPLKIFSLVQECYSQGARQYLLCSAHAHIITIKTGLIWSFFGKRYTYFEVLYNFIAWERGQLGLSRTHFLVLILSINIWVPISGGGQNELLSTVKILRK